LIAVSVFAHFNARATHDHRASDQYSATLEDADLIQLIVHQVIGFDVDGLLAICFFRRRRYRHNGHQQRKRERSKWSQGTNIAR